MGASDNSFDYKFKKLQSYIKRTYSVESYSDKFNSLKHDHERVEMAYYLFSEAKLLSEEVKLINHLKSSKESTALREKGNKEFRMKQDYIALQMYSLSVAFAPANSEELALAFANRSAVTFSLKEYATCVKDIDRALAGSYPQNLQYKLYERKGKCLSFLGMTDLAKDVFLVALNCLHYSNLDEEKFKSTSFSLTKHLNECSGKKIACEKEKNCLLYLSASKNEVILSASSLIKIQYSEELGRHIVATADIEPGDILVIEKPFSSILLPSSYTSHCFECKKRCHALIPCLSCIEAMYCSEDCRSISWEKDHRIGCSLVPFLIALDFTKIELIAVQTLLIVTKQNKSLKELIETIPELESFEDNRTKGFDKEGYYNSADYKSVHHLVGNIHLRSNADVFRRAATAAYILNLLDKHTDYFSSDVCHGNVNDQQSLNPVKLFVGGLLLKYLMIVPSNAHEISEMVLKKVDGELVCQSAEIGGALYPVLSLINHSCDPNVVRHNHNGDLNVLTAIQVIAAGEQIVDNYGYHHAMHDLATRQSNLWPQYHFNCQCRACVEDWPIYSQLPNLNPEYINPSLKGEIEKSSEVFQEVLGEIKSGKMDRKLAFLLAHLSLLHRGIRRPWREYSMCQEAIKQCLTLKANHYFTVG